MKKKLKEAASSMGKHVFACLLFIHFQTFTNAQTREDSLLTINQYTFDSLVFQKGDTITLGVPFEGDTYQFICWYANSCFEKGWGNHLLVLDHFRKDKTGRIYPVFHGFLYEFYGRYREADIWPTEIYAILPEALNHKEIQLGYKKLD